MISTKKKHPTKLVRGIIIFISIALIVQTAFVLLLTPDGLRFLYPYIIVAGSEEITTGDADLGEYFPLHSVASDSELIILSADTGVADTYRLAGDFLQFIGRFTEISSVVLYTSNSRVSGMSDAALDGDYEKFSSACDAQKTSKTLSDQLYNFLDKIYVMNSKLPPNMKFTISGIEGVRDFSDIQSRLASDLLSDPGAFNKINAEILNVETADEFAALFEENSEVLAGILKGDFEYYEKHCSYIAEDAIEEGTAIENLKKYSPSGEGTVFAILPEYLCKDGSAFIKMAEEAYDEVTVINTVYYDCTTLSENEEVARDDGAFPKMFSGIRIVDANELKDFRAYYKKVTNSFDSDKLTHRMNMIGEAGERTFFIISGSGAVSFNSDDDKVVTGNVDVAPG